MAVGSEAIRTGSDAEEAEHTGVDAKRIRVDDSLRGA